MEKRILRVVSCPLHILNLLMFVRQILQEQISVKQASPELMLRRQIFPVVLTLCRLFLWDHRDIDFSEADLLWANVHAVSGRPDRWTNANLSDVRRTDMEMYLAEIWKPGAPQNGVNKRKSVPGSMDGRKASTAQWSMTCLVKGTFQLKPEEVQCLQKSKQILRVILMLTRI